MFAASRISLWDPVNKKSLVFAYKQLLPSSMKDVKEAGCNEALAVYQCFRTGACPCEKVLLGNLWKKSCYSRAAHPDLYLISLKLPGANEGWPGTWQYRG